MFVVAPSAPPLTAQEREPAADEEERRVEISLVLKDKGGASEAPAVERQRQTRSVAGHASAYHDEDEGDSHSRLNDKIRVVQDNEELVSKPKEKRKRGRPKLTAKEKEKKREETADLIDGRKRRKNIDKGEEKRKEKEKKRPPTSEEEEDELRGGIAGHEMSRGPMIIDVDNGSTDPHHRVHAADDVDQDVSGLYPTSNTSSTPFGFNINNMHHLSNIAAINHMSELGSLNFNLNNTILATQDDEANQAYCLILPTHPDYFAYNSNNNGGGSQLPYNGLAQLSPYSQLSTKQSYPGGYEQDGGGGIAGIGGGVEVQRVVGQQIGGPLQSPQLQNASVPAHTRITKKLRLAQLQMYMTEEQKEEQRVKDEEKQRAETKKPCTQRVEEKEEEKGKRKGNRYTPKRSPRKLFWQQYTNGSRSNSNNIIT